MAEITVNERIELLRKEMKKNGLTAYIIPSADPHQSEYVAEHYKSRAYISGFTGSLGTVIVTLTESCLWTDGRYFIQAAKQISDSEVVLYKMLEPGVPTYQEWLKENIEHGEKIGFDQRLFSVNDIKMLKNIIGDKIELVGNIDLISNIWTNRPPLPMDQVFYHDIEYTGQTALEKINTVRAEMKKKEAQVYLMSSLNDIAWLFNIRGNDIIYTPITYAYSIITLTQAILYIQLSKVPDKVRKTLEEQNIIIKPYTDIFADIETITKDSSVIYDPAILNYGLKSMIAPSSRIIESIEPTALIKAKLSKKEIENLKQCEINDGAALVKFLYWLEKNVPNGNVTEFSASEKLTNFRQELPLYIEDSFATIAAYKGNAAMMHYKPEESTAKTLKPEGLLLVDSGGQYYNGTTDITRTIVLGDITEEERHDFTLVLKSHIALAKLIFLHGSTGSNLDAIARQPIWQEYMDYKCGTGHSVGYLLGVHEGPSRLRKEHNNVVIEAGMYLTNEPGIYKENKHGIRTENSILSKDILNNSDGYFMGFDVISYCPIDLKGIDESMLTNDEKKWLNNYHQEVYDKLSPYLKEEECLWLKTQTKSI
ncbi:Xaa-Pro aminopeptidase [Vallitalea longa]|uniref:Xaa-Pro aminopeptidase n=1 Tax=Vallitalea longa TaxID=2936439 RepID=A0A9W6DEA5_9FIRM|nr:aminopeptidase P family protein [Vallitalea longa]GKX28218.1 Xaa-Pro aminopeptidase [Vallitalea longa]